ncbi:hypothetical protein [Pusillimonas noertemannii]|uniref:Uncharacterized protein n=1 Tax=Pusillimonas noertemannii TaxID=305977 RepID=A0A2U1CS02_9BURK|nr:hypothetical protein [Pusillimonas noertemannii]NYT67997.1 hypothetical protein [Pusillimonas noertemannii]PVY68675.1 hypothetical protein C7440_1086 [Pusillimonas noertemannii]TFL11864.1 hypothetical protein CSC72_01660 [Pusillimonas noertemannii]
MWVSSILSGLAGGVLASGLTILYSYRLDKRKEHQAKTAHSFSLISALEAYAINCAGYIESAGEDIAEAYHTQDTNTLSKVRTPKFEIPANADFRTINAALASRVLTLPHLIRRSEEISFSIFVYNDAIEATYSSIKQCGIRGLSAWQLATELRCDARLPAPEFDTDWTFLAVLEKAANP